MFSEDLRYQFVVHAYEAMMKQIQQFDVKVSVLLSWNGVIAVILGREVVLLFAQVKATSFILFSLVMAVVFLIVSSVFCYAMLRPRLKENEEGEGIFWAGDILRLGVDHMQRVERYLTLLREMRSVEDYARQVVHSVVAVSEIFMRKTRFFFFALASTITSFLFLILLIVQVGLGR